MIKFENISKFFCNRDGNKKHILNNVSFEINKNEIFCITGPFGCGKSTIINLLAGFIRPDSGAVSVNGNVVLEPSHSRTVVFQDNALFPWKTVIQNIEFGLKCLGFDRRQREIRVKKMLRLIKLEKFENYYPDQLSGGMKQMVALGRALVVDPEIILMDEPFSSLDQQTRDIFQEDLLKIKTDNEQTILLVTHNIDEAIFLGDKILILSSRPAHVKNIITVLFEKPRKPDIRNSLDFFGLKEKIWRELRENV